MELVELLVRMDCKGCERKVRKQLSKLKGVDSVEIDIRMNKVTVLGYVDRRKVLKAVRKTGKRAEFWQEAFNRFHDHSYHDADDGSTYSSTSYHSNNYSYNKPSSYFGSHILQHHPFKRTYNYVKHGYNHYNYNHLDDETMPHYNYGTASIEAPSMFSDENPNACSIM
ncbi:hypothetical protein GOP47_0010365 [Adiantum capillus-veneris]|uniref:HMA domain-containing protein n=1 Tax=Adiantum capillus-veneris TaxID=13818 RepID=A0A9D4UUL9_ADICA|nr:hypothetical protein GOP47_0010365 [Adiantum capillus-veneris]